MTAIKPTFLKLQLCTDPARVAMSANTNANVPIATSPSVQCRTAYAMEGSEPSSQSVYNGSCAISQPVLRIASTGTYRSAMKAHAACDRNHGCSVGIGPSIIICVAGTDFRQRDCDICSAAGTTQPWATPAPGNCASGPSPRAQAYGSGRGRSPR